MSTTATRPWQAEIIDQLGAADDDPALTHAVVYLPPPEATDEVDLLDRCDTAASALISAEDWATKVEGGEVRIVTLADLVAWNRDHDHPVDGLTIEPRRQNVEGEPDKVIDDEPLEDDEPDDEPTPEPAPGEQTTAFTAADYDREDLQIPKVDGETIDKIRVDFGSILLDRSAAADVAMINGMKLGKEVELRVAGTVSGVGTGYTTNREGDLDVVVLSKKIKVGTVWVLAPENLG